MSYFPSYRTAAQRAETRIKAHSRPSVSMEAIRREARLIAIEDNVRLDFLREQLKISEIFIPERSCAPRS